MQLRAALPWLASSMDVPWRVLQVSGQMPNRAGIRAPRRPTGLRSLLLETQGYEAQVFEFISPEHTGKNKMILGNRTGRARDADAVRAEIEALKRFYGIRTQRLDGLLGGGMSAAGNPGEN